MHHELALIPVLVLFLVAGCGRDQSISKPQPSTETNEVDLRFQRMAAEGHRLLTQADVVFRVVTSEGRGEFVRPSPLETNGLTSPSNFQAALRSVQQRKAVLILIPAEGYDTNIATNAAAWLKQLGFQSVQIGVERWGKVFPGPEL